MTYALLTHVPTYAGQSPGVVRMTDGFRDDLLAQAAALRAAGFSVTLATPRHAAPDARSLARERYVDVRLADLGVVDAPLPAWRTMPQFLAAKPALDKAIVAVAAGAAVVQMGAGGHPTALGQVAWPRVDPATSKRVFVFAGDPLPARRRSITSGRNPAKRLAKGLAVRSFETFLRRAIDEADLVFAHDPAVAKRFAKHWRDATCHTFTASSVADADLADAAVIAARQKRLADTARPLRAVALASGDATAGVEHVLRAVAKVRRLGVAVTLTLSGVAKAAGLAGLVKELEIDESKPGGPILPSAGGTREDFDAADVFLAAPLVPGEIPAIFSAAGRGLPILSYRGGTADNAALAAGGAVLVERGDADRLAQALLELAHDRPRLVALAESARGWAAGGDAGRGATTPGRTGARRGRIVRIGNREGSRRHRQLPHARPHGRLPAVARARGGAGAGDARGGDR